MSPDPRSGPLGRVHAFALRLRARARYAAGHAPARIAIMVFAVATLVFTGLLMLPAASADGTLTELPDALFTAVSAVTVTGLTTVDTGGHWSMFGQVVILAAIQTGALGVVTIALLLAMMVTRKLGVSGRVFAKESIGADGIGGVGRLLRVVVTTTFLIEAALALVLVPAFIAAGESFPLGLWHGIFYAISAFGNAGFTPHVGGLAAFAGNPFVLTPIAVGVFVGSFGFPVFLNLIRARWTRHKWTLHTKLTLITTTVLFGLGALAWAVFEWSNPDTVGGAPWWQKIGHALFASTMLRSGGFSLVDMESSTATTMLLSDALMFVGGGSASTAGGIKVTTLAVLFLAIVAEAKGTRHTNALGRRLPDGTLRLAISVVFLGATLVFVAAALLTIVSDAKLDRILFEVISAFATCGLSVGISSEVGAFGKFVLSALMLTGRVGPIVLASALAVRQRRELYTFPVERPIIG
ncbi:TrkH family potassium uptake protein [Leucobacter sp. CSA1]|uniref:TrkH family potassium uptake protein n=1 Tax=Leucobacter chromiisoli TaxID=2796471 RepID=A0A934UWA2_9MICO|nr:TrkH family potassium uptake protein [Leucobacter chromiisoli]MBK0420321.1 TrkH family potassium uptake protein [Leucobacter chromiisoli]